MKQAINSIVDANKDTDVKKGLETLWRMARNIIRDPNEPKFRILKKTNKWVLLLLALKDQVDELIKLAGYTDVDSEHYEFEGKDIKPL